MQFTTDERHSSTLDFLAEVRDYLARWPAHPVNRQMLAQIDAHLAEPTHDLIRQASQEREGTAFTPGGLCIIRAVHHGDTLNLSVPRKPKAAGDATIIKALNHGLTLTLKPTE